jgi:hypothetical protein
VAVDFEQVNRTAVVAETELNLLKGHGCVVIRAIRFAVTACIAPQTPRMKLNYRCCVIPLGLSCLVVGIEQVDLAAFGWQVVLQRHFPRVRVAVSVHERVHESAWIGITLSSFHLRLKTIWIARELGPTVPEAAHP